MQERRLAEQRLQELNENLERLVADRTAELHDKALQLEAANKEIQAFSYSISHDLKAPLRKMDQFIGMLNSKCADALDEEMRMYLERISANAVQMNELICK